MENELESLRQKLNQERHALRRAESGFLLGAMGFTWVMYWFSSAHPQHSNVLVTGIGAALSGVLFALLLVAIYRIKAYRTRKRDENRRFGRILHGKDHG